MIEEGNWLCLNEQMSEHRGSGFDAIICMGNSFAHLPDFSGDQHDQRTAITNFYELLKPGGILVIDHRNYDYILEHGAAPTKNIYYSVNIFRTPIFNLTYESYYVIYFPKLSRIRESCLFS